MIKTERVYEYNGSQRGYRVLVDRLWPRGIKKEKVDLSYAVDYSFDVSCRVEPGTATAGQYTLVNSTFTFPAGQTENNLPRRRDREADASQFFRFGRPRAGGGVLE